MNSYVNSLSHNGDFFILGERRTLWKRGARPFDTIIDQLTSGTPVVPHGRSVNVEIALFNDEVLDTLTDDMKVRQDRRLTRRRGNNGRQRNGNETLAAARPM